MDKRWLVKSLVFTSLIPDIAKMCSRINRHGTAVIGYTQAMENKPMNKSSRRGHSLPFYDKQADLINANVSSLSKSEGVI